MADLYATATGLIERSAAAYASGVPEDASDDGFFGPASVAWRVSADLASPVAGLRALLMQALHPLAMAGVDQHSGWRRDPVGRLAATSAYLATITFGERAEAEGAAVRVRRIHEHVTRRRRGDRPAVRGGRSRPAAVGARRAGRVQHGGRPGCSARRSRRRKLIATSRRWWSRPSLSACPGPSSPPASRNSTGISYRSGRSCAAPRRPGSRWPTCSIRRAWTRRSPRSGRTSGTARSPSLPEWAREMYGYTAPQPPPGTRPPDGDPAGARRAGRGVPRRAGRAGGPAADHPADARSAAGMKARSARRRGRWRGGAAAALALVLLRRRAGRLRYRPRAGGAPAGRARRDPLRGQRAAAVRGRGRAAPAAAQRPGPADRRGRRRHAGDDEGRHDEDRPDGQLRRRRACPPRSAARWPGCRTASRR